MVLRTLYFVQMDADCCKSKHSKAGAELCLGYCDAPCPHDLKVVNNDANIEGWKQSDTGNCMVEGADAECEATDGVRASGSERAGAKQQVAIGFLSNEFMNTKMKSWPNRAKS